jgi:hypothetical protein
VANKTTHQDTLAEWLCTELAGMSASLPAGLKAVRKASVDDLGLPLSTAALREDGAGAALPCLLVYPLKVCREPDRVLGEWVRADHEFGVLYLANPASEASPQTALDAALDLVEQAVLSLREFQSALDDAGRTGALQYEVLSVVERVVDSPQVGKLRGLCGTVRGGEIKVLARTTTVVG